MNGQMSNSGRSAHCKGKNEPSKIAIFERTKAFKFWWVIYMKVFSKILFCLVAVFLIAKSPFWLSTPLLPFFVRFECLMTKYGNMCESNQSPKLLIYIVSYIYYCCSVNHVDMNNISWLLIVLLSYLVLHICNFLH